MRGFPSLSRRSPLLEGGGSGVCGATISAARSDPEGRRSKYHKKRLLEFCRSPARVATPGFCPVLSQESASRSPGAGSR
ncbi:MAG: hypothetical protein MZV64_18380, partial [Ignavibacteriales bacterium]|nr:hypothetical protein [Ignavibacteriales bacterium]